MHWHCYVCPGCSQRLRIGELEDDPGYYIFEYHMAKSIFDPPRPLICDQLDKLSRLGRRKSGLYPSMEEAIIALDDTIEKWHSSPEQAF